MLPRPRQPFWDPVRLADRSSNDRPTPPHWPDSEPKKLLDEPPAVVGNSEFLSQASKPVVLLGGDMEIELVEVVTENLKSKFVLSSPGGLQAEAQPWIQLGADPRLHLGSGTTEKQLDHVLGLGRHDYASGSLV
jgi:hypothetical protein